MTKNKKQNKEQKKEKKMRFVFFFQTSNLHLIKQKYKSFFKLFFIVKHVRKTRIFLKKKIENK